MKKLLLMSFVFCFSGMIYGSPQTDIIPEEMRFPRICKSGFLPLKVEHSTIADTCMVTTGCSDTGILRMLAMTACPLSTCKKFEKLPRNYKITEIVDYSVCEMVIKEIAKEETKPVAKAKGKA
ncbi:MAG: hypothetical protein NTY22_06050 [Proteobacteria bacterium]|nr:hypothetical protein [Pseudomonadota bacterium]